jgi:hypothetical protein
MGAEVPMLFAIQHENGRRSEVLLLAVGEERMRLAPRNGLDTIELTRMGERWYDERGRRITIGAVVAIEGVDYSRCCADGRPRVMTAGGN